jgi:hypothetical protein
MVGKFVRLKAEPLHDSRLSPLIYRLLFYSTLTGIGSCFHRSLENNFREVKNEQNKKRLYLDIRSMEKHCILSHLTRTKIEENYSLIF